MEFQASHTAASRCGRGYAKRLAVSLRFDGTERRLVEERNGFNG